MPILPAKCKTKQSLEDHIENLHEKTKSFRCDICSKVLNCRQSLRMHNQRFHTNDTFKCDFCTMVFKTNQDFLRHLKRIHQSNNEKVDCKSSKKFRSTCQA